MVLNKSSSGKCMENPPLAKGEKGDFIKKLKYS